MAGIDIDIQGIATIISVSISSIALFFSLYLSWDLYWRKSKIIVSDPLLYAIWLDSEEPKSLSMRISLIFLNEGGATRFIQDLKLIVEQNGRESNELLFAGTSPSMDDPKRHLAEQFAIEGHRAHSATFFFYRKPGGFVPSKGICKAKLEAKIDDGNWEKVHEFNFIIKADQNLHIMASHYCDDHDL